MEVVEDYESRPHNAVSFVVRREKETQESNVQKLPKVLSGYSGGRLPGRSTKEKGREEGGIDKEGGDRRVRGQGGDRGTKKDGRELLAVGGHAVVEDTEEIRKWRGSSQSEMDFRWKNLAGRMEEEVLDKYKVEESKREAF